MADDIEFEVTGDLDGLKRAFQGLFAEIKRGAKEVQTALQEGMFLEKSGFGVGQNGPKLFGIAMGAAAAVGAVAFATLKSVLQEVTDAFKTLVASATEWVQMAIKADQYTAQLEAALKSSGRGAEFTKDQLLAMGKELENLTNISGETIKSVLTMQLKFQDIKGDRFKELAGLALDMSVRMKTDAANAANVLGRALQNPEQSIYQLTKAGVKLDDAQKEMIKHFKLTGEAGESQKIILNEIKEAFGGAAQAAADASGGGFAKIKKTIEDIKEDLGHELMPAVEAVAPAIKFMAEEAAKWIKKMSEAMSEMVSGWAKAFDISPAEAMVGVIAVLTNEVKKLVFELSKVGAATRFAQLSVKDAFPGVDLTPAETQQKAFDAATLLKSPDSTSNIQIFKDAVVAFREAVLKDKETADRTEAANRQRDTPRIIGPDEAAFSKAFPKFSGSQKDLAFGGDVALRTAQNLVPAWAEKLTNSMVSIATGKDTVFTKLNKLTETVTDFAGDKLKGGFKAVLDVATEGMKKEKPREVQVESFQALFQRIQVSAAGDSPARKTAKATEKTAENTQELVRSMTDAHKTFGIGVQTLQEIRRQGGLG